MNEGTLKKLARELSALCVFRGVLEREPLQNLLCVLSCEDSDVKRASLYGRFVASLAPYGYSLTRFLRRALAEDDNPFIRGAAGDSVCPDFVAWNAKRELALLTRLTRMTVRDLWPDDAGDAYLPEFDNQSEDFTAYYMDRVNRVNQVGYGVFAASGMFHFTEDGIVPVSHPDGITLDRFIGYDAPRRQLIGNTEALLHGRPAANALLFGDAGTGKSSTVKACANYFYDRGLRLIELRKDQLISLPRIMGAIAGNPLKFILFIDDLSLSGNDDAFGMLKAALEGSASARASNAVIYATSNRRHIVRERFSDRSVSDEVHRGDTTQELMSLSDRFGLRLYFEKPEKALYIEIVHAMAEKAGLQSESGALDAGAEAFALAHGSRSPRVAEQFITSIIVGGNDKP